MAAFINATQAAVAALSQSTAPCCVGGCVSIELHSAEFRSSSGSTFVAIREAISSLEVPNRTPHAFCVKPYTRHNLRHRGRCLSLDQAVDLINGLHQSQLGILCIESLLAAVLRLLSISGTPYFIRTDDSFTASKQRGAGAGAGAGAGG